MPSQPELGGAAPPDQTARTEPLAMKASLDHYLEGLFADLSARPLCDRPSVLLSGAVRCGKTKLASALAARAGYVHLRTDRIRNATYLDSPPAARRRAVKYLYRRILLRFPAGVLLEGTALTDAPCDLPLWAAARGIPFFAIGYSTGTAEQKCADLLAYRAENRCWTRHNKSDADMLKFARRLIARSREIRAFCAAHDLPYYDLESSQFEAEHSRILADIEMRLAAQGRAASTKRAIWERVKFWRF
jgi:hypothetical protein